MDQLNMINLSGRSVRTDITAELKQKVSEFKVKPQFVIITVGDDMASNVYVKNKLNYAREVGIDAKHKIFAEDVSKSELIMYIKQLNDDSTINGIIVQLPLPSQLNSMEITSHISMDKDIDGFTAGNISKDFYGDNSGLSPCTVEAIFDILKYYQIEVSGKNIVVVGRSNIVGKPLIIRLINEGATVTACNSKTTDIKYYIDRADIFISAIGQANYFTKDYFEQTKDLVIIDVGMNRDENNKLCGDVDYHNVINGCAAITPVPGGVGVVTVVNVIKNVIKAYEKQRGEL